ncbi:MAG: translation elongation factor Ts [Deltaproteobacteria bacterium]|jgi:elongation factor Ts|nr:translation elongation factor Ts [Deltaproteobacteria bacterium]
MAAVTASAVKELREVTGVAMMDCKKALVECEGDMDAAKEFLRKKGQAKALKKSSRETSEGAIGLATGADNKSAALVKLACESDFVARNEKFQTLLQQLSGQVLACGDEDVLNQTTSGGGTVQELLTQNVAELGENMQFLDAKQAVVINGTVGSYVHMTGKIGVLVPLETEAPCDNDRLQVLARNIAMHIAATPSEAVRPDQVDATVLEKEKELLEAQARESGKPEEIIEKIISGRVNKFLKEVCVETQPFVKDPQVTVGQLVKNTSKALGTGINFDRFVKFQF